MTTTTFGIGGMHCASCVARNERTLLKLPGVHNVSVNLATRRALVEFDEAAISVAAIRGGGRGNGYQVLIGENAAGHKARAAGELRRARALAFGALALALPVAVLAMADVSLPWTYCRSQCLSVWLQAAF